MRTQQPHLSDFLHTLHDDSLPVSDAAVEPLYAPAGTPPVRLQFVQVRRESIILVLPAEASAALTQILAALPSVASHLLRLMAERRGIVTSAQLDVGSDGRSVDATAPLDPGRRRPHQPRPPLALRRGDKIDCWNCHHKNDQDEVYCVGCGVVGCGVRLRR